MRSILAVVLVVLAVLIILVLGTGLVVLLAYGIGWLLSQFLPFSQFESTLVSLIGIAMVGVVLYQFAGALISGPDVDDDDDDYEWLLDDDDWDEDDEDWDDDDEDLEEDGDDEFVPGIPRWRQARPKPTYYDVGRNDPCPCGSGKKFKHCHGAPK